MIHKTPNLIPVILECRDCNLTFENEYHQKEHFINTHLPTKVSRLRDESIELQIKQEIISMASKDLPERQQILVDYKDAQNITKLIS